MFKCEGKGYGLSSSMSLAKMQIRSFGQKHHLDTHENVISTSSFRPSHMDGFVLKTVTHIGRDAFSPVELIVSTEK